VKMLHLQERLGVCDTRFKTNDISDTVVQQSFQLLDSSRETLSSAVQTPIMCVLANELVSYDKRQHRTYSDSSTEFDVAPCVALL